MSAKDELPSVSKRSSQIWSIVWNVGNDHDSYLLTGEYYSAPEVDLGGWCLLTIGADDGQLGNNSTKGNLLFTKQVAGVVSQSMGKNLRKSPSIRLLTSAFCGDIFLLWTAR